MNTSESYETPLSTRVGPIPAGTGAQEETPLIGHEEQNEEDDDPPFWTYYKLSNFIRRQRITASEGKNIILKNM